MRGFMMCLFGHALSGMLLRTGRVAGPRGSVASATRRGVGPGRVEAGAALGLAGQRRAAGIFPGR